jgi:hypothetical protein
MLHAMLHLSVRGAIALLILAIPSLVAILSAAPGGGGCGTACQ